MGRRTGKPPGRPRWVPTKEIIERVEGLAGRGLNFEEIAISLGISKATLYSAKAEFAEFLNAIARGKAKAKIIMTNLVFETAQNPAVPIQTRLQAGTTWLNAVGNWKQKVETTEATPPSAPSVEDLLERHGPDDAQKIAEILREAHKGIPQAPKADAP